MKSLDRRPRVRTPEAKHPTILLVSATEPGGKAPGPMPGALRAIGSRPTRSPADRMRSMSAFHRNARHRDALVRGPREGLIKRL